MRVVSRRLVTRVNMLMFSSGCRGSSIRETRGSWSEGFRRVAKVGAGGLWSAAHWASWSGVGQSPWPLGRMCHGPHHGSLCGHSTAELIARATGGLLCPSF